MRRCCDLSGLEHIEVEGRMVGIFGLREAIVEVASLGLSDEERIGEELLLADRRPLRLASSP